MAGEEIPDWTREIELSEPIPPFRTSVPAPSPGEAKPVTVEGFKALIQKQGHLPSGLYGKNLGIDHITKYLVSEAATEQLIDLTGVRYLGQVSFLVLTDQRLCCVTLDTGNFSLTTQVKAHFSEPLQAIQQVTIGSNGLIVDGRNLYFVQPKLGAKFAQTLSEYMTVELVQTIATDAHEKNLLALVCGYIVLSLGVGWFWGSITSYYFSGDSRAPSMVSCINEARAQLKSSSTVTFTGIFERPEEALKAGDKWQWAAWADFQDSSGTAIRKAFVCKSDGKVLMVQLMD